jgi:anti-sigma regulatory factor (Ser/Thr protein kinase)
MALRQPMTSLTVPAQRDQLEAVLEFADSSCEQLGITGGAAFAVRLAVEEIALNVMSYAYEGGDGPLSLDIDARDGMVVLTIADRGTPFSPDQAPAPDLDASVEERAIGGLGIHLVRRMMDSVTYVAGNDGWNRLVMTKALA